MKVIVAVVIVLFSISTGYTVKEQPDKKPNILFIMVDDLVPALGCYGNEVVQSPHIDKLASEGVQFSQAFCNVPVCGASRASILTGIRPHYPDRFITFTSRADKDYPSAITLPKLLKENGYYTISNGKIFHDADDSENSWSEAPWRDRAPMHLKKYSDDEKNSRTKRGPFFETADVSDTAYSDGLIAQKTIRDLNRLSGMKQPFFLAVGFKKPHLPFNAPQKYFDRYDSGEITLADNRFDIEHLPAGCKNSKEVLSYGNTDHFNSDRFHYEARHAYYACVSYVDEQIGKLLTELERLGMEKNTIVVLIGDHGYHLGDHNFWGKHNTLYEALHAPLLIKVPGRKPLKIDQITEFVDLYPTLCDLTSISAPKEIHGESMVSLMEGQGMDWKNRAFSEWMGARSILAEGYAYTYWFQEKNKGMEMLFDHTNDPAENKNIAAVHPDIAGAFKEEIETLYKKLESKN